jgi:hypothetical protein
MDGKTLHDQIVRIVETVDDDARRVIGELVRGAFRDGAVAALESMQTLAIEEPALETLTWEHLARLCQHALDVVRAVADEHEVAAS